ncbi:MAG: ribonuclease J [Candidatus Yanofskybacteria bacterium]|nr:ribonuclease J [Candidatus Yanofskybacteria bacterium]
MSDDSEKHDVSTAGFGPGLEPAAPSKEPTATLAVAPKAPLPQRAYHAEGAPRPARRRRPMRRGPGAPQRPPAPTEHTPTPARQGDTPAESTGSAGSGGRGGGRRRDRRMNMPRKKLPSQRKLQPTQLHEGRIGAPAGMEASDTLKVMALGGLGEIGKNCYVLEYKDDILVIDAGILFPDESMPGIDFIIPNTAYLESKRENIRGFLLTHGHMDHVGAVPYVQTKLGNPDIYTAELTKNMVLKRHTEFPHLPKLPIHVVKDGDRVKMGDHFTVEFFHVNHNIPDDLGVFVETPVGNFIHTADFKFDPSPVNDRPMDLQKIREYGDRGVLAMMIDSTDAERPGHGVSEQTIYENMDAIFKDATGMLIIGTFSSMINRMQQIVQLSEKYGRKVIFDGYSLKTNVEIAKEMGYMKIQKGTQISMEQLRDYPRDRITVVATGAMGQEGASLMRIVNGEHRHIQMQKKDTVIFSSSVIPGNERSVQYLKDMLYRGGVKVYHYQMMDIHAGGHARQEDLKEMMLLTRPKFLMPHHGHYSMMVSNGELGKAVGIPDENIIIADNGQIVNFTADQWWFDKKTIPANYVMVDGLGVGDIGNVVLRDRQALAEDGMFTIVMVIDPKTGRMRTSPDIISRGFIYLKEQKDLLMQVRKKVRHIVESEKARPLNLSYLKDEIRDQVGLFLFQKTERRPMVLPVIIEV